MTLTLCDAALGPRLALDDEFLHDGGRGLTEGSLGEAASSQLGALTPSFPPAFPPDGTLTGAGAPPTAEAAAEADKLRARIKELEAAGVRVLWPYNPWDTGTRREPLDDEHTFAKLLKQTGGDGFNGDTMGYVPESFWWAAEEANYPLAFEPEGGGSALDGCGA